MRFLASKDSTPCGLGGQVPTLPGLYVNRQLDPCTIRGLLPVDTSTFTVLISVAMGSHWHSAGTILPYLTALPCVLSL